MNDWLKHRVRSGQRRAICIALRLSVVQMYDFSSSEYRIKNYSLSRANDKRQQKCNEDQTSLLHSVLVLLPHGVRHSDIFATRYRVWLVRLSSPVLYE